MAVYLDWPLLSHFSPRRDSILPLFCAFPCEARKRVSRPPGRHCPGGRSCARGAPNRLGPEDLTTPCSTRVVRVLEEGIH